MGLQLDTPNLYHGLEARLVDYLLVIWRIVSIMGLKLGVILLIIGKPPIGELPVFDFLVLVVLGAIVGADIADPNEYSGR